MCMFLQQCDWFGGEYVTNNCTKTAGNNVLSRLQIVFRIFLYAFYSQSLSHVIILC